MKNFQLMLFNHPTLVNPAQAESLNPTSDELWELFKAEYESAKLIPSNPVMVELPNTEGIIQMGRKQVRRYNTSKRLRQDCDQISMLAKVAWSFYLGEPAHKVFDDWNDALGKGNKGIFWSWPGEAVGSRATKGNNDKFIYSRNRYSDFITAHTFARVQLQHSGTAFVELLGWSQRHKMAPHTRDHGQMFTINVATLQRHGQLNTPDDFRTRFLANNLDQE
jgi:hypothetical protein